MFGGGGGGGGLGCFTSIIFLILYVCLSLFWFLFYIVPGLTY